MLFITGDVHHRSLNTRDQSSLFQSEVELARAYADIAAQHSVEVTLFVSGKTVEEDPALVAGLADRDNVEIGGHNWSCFEWSILHFFSELVLDSHYGPAAYQRWDVKKTLDAIEAKTGTCPRSWRSHAFVEDEQTAEILTAAGLDVVSNTVGPERPISSRSDGLVSLPINTLPDHSHVYHGWLSKEYIIRQNRIRRKGPAEVLSLGRVPTRAELARAIKETVKMATGSRRRSSFEHQWFTAQEWVARVRTQIDAALDSHGYATVLAHPACMELADKMEAFERLCAFASDRETGFVCQATTILNQEGR